MKERLRSLLRILMDRDSFMTIQDLAREIGAGERTIFRDIQELEYYLQRYSVSIEKRRSLGIRLQGNTQPLITLKNSKHSRLGWLGIRQRQLAILIYLGHTPGIIKLGELATMFDVTDSSISNDLKEIDGFLAGLSAHVTLVRLKGIGVTLEGDEWHLRTALLAAATELIEPRDLIQHIIYKKENDRLEEMIDLLGYGAMTEDIVKAITGAEQHIGYRFSWYDLGILYTYILIALKRKDFPQPVSMEIFGIPFSIPDIYAGELWAAIAEPLEREETFLCAVLSSLEPGELRETNRSHPDMDRIVSRLIAGLEGNANPVYDFDSRLHGTLTMSISALVYKKIFRIPSQKRPAESAGQGITSLQNIDAILTPLLSQHFGISITPEDSASILMIIRAAEEMFSGNRKKYRILVTCFEGICMAQLIASQLRTHVQDVVVVAALACDRVTNEWVKKHGIDLVITTFPTGLTQAPEFILTTPFDTGRFHTEITDFLSRFEASAGFTGDALNARPENPSMDASINAAIDILHGFALHTLKSAISENEITEVIAGIAAPDAKHAALLRSDFDKREAYGAVILEQEHIRLFHCRSRALSKPAAGVVRTIDDRKTYFYLVSPDPAGPEVIHSLSLISIALVESAEFPAAIVNRDESEIKRHLFGILATSL